MASEKVTTRNNALAMPENWRRSADGVVTFGALLTNFSKPLDCLDHGLIIAKPNSYISNWPALKLIHDYLSLRKRRARINNSYSEWLATKVWGLGYLKVQYWDHFYLFITFF